MLSIGTFNGESDIEDTPSPDGQNSPQYSDHINSDIEIELYNRVHHGVLNKNVNLLDMFTPNPLQNGFCDRHVPREKSANVRVETVNIEQEVPPRTLKVKQGPQVKNGKYKIPLHLKKIKASQKKQAKKVPLEVSETTDDSSDYDISLFCVDECYGLEDDLMLNVKGEKFSSYVKTATSLNVSSNSDDDVICIDSTPDKKVNMKRSKKFQPVTIDIEDSSDCSSNEEIASSSKKVRKQDILETDDDAWHLDPEDKYPAKKRIPRYHDAKPKCRNCGEAHSFKLCPKARLVKCYICGEGHKSAVCNKKVCSFCYQLGHNYLKCPNKHIVKKMQCEICKLSGHTFKLCPDLWRRFHATTTSNTIARSSMTAVDSDRVFCYNCGFDGHFGHQCSYPLSRVSSSPSWPYVVSYKNPRSLMRSESAVIQTNKSMRKKYIAKNRKRKYADQGVSHDASTPVNSGRITLQNKPFFKKRKLLFREQNFLRTPSTSESTVTSNQFISRRQKRKQRKRMMNNSQFISSNYTV